MELYPLKFTPILKERLWGGNKLATVLEKPTEGDRIGESWELSGVPGDISVVANGHYRGRTLKDLIAAYSRSLLGDRVLDLFGTDFPILVKFIDAREDLSIQLHPGDELARKRHGSFGKTEMWFVMEADPGSELIIGFNRDVSREEYQNALQAGRLLELLNYEPVGEGDTFFINSGKIHAIGGGILLAEIQQSSDVTYRVYDFDRDGSTGGGPWAGKQNGRKRLFQDLLPGTRFQLEFGISFPGFLQGLCMRGGERSAGSRVLFRSNPKRRNRPAACCNPWAQDRYPGMPATASYLIGNPPVFAGCCTFVSKQKFMASIRDLKKDINNVLGDIIEAVYIVEGSQQMEGSKEGSAIIDKAIDTFDALIAKVNQKDVADRKAHLKEVRASLEKEATDLVGRLNKMG